MAECDKKRWYSFTVSGRRPSREAMWDHHPSQRQVEITWTKGGRRVAQSPKQSMKVNEKKKNPCLPMSSRQEQGHHRAGDQAMLSPGVTEEEWIRCRI